MYINKFNRETNYKNIIEFIQQNSFGTLVNSIDNIPQATHVPFLIETGNNNELYVRTHLARANPQWKTFSPEQEVLVIFQGPNTYISPRWYNHINVPTMNYMAVHVYGTCRVIEDSEMVYQLLKSQIEQFEKEHISEYNINTLPEKFLKAEMRALVALEVKVNRTEANFKLSQNRDEENYRNIISRLELSADEDAKAIAGEMKKIQGNIFHNP